MTVNFAKGTTIDILEGTLVCIMKNVVGGIEKPIGSVTIEAKTYDPDNPAFKGKYYMGIYQVISGASGTAPVVDSNGNFWINLN